MGPMITDQPAVTNLQIFTDVHQMNGETPSTSPLASPREALTAAPYEHQPLVSTYPGCTPSEGDLWWTHLEIQLSCSNLANPDEQVNPDQNPQLSHYENITFSKTL